MPELPDVELYRSALARSIVGARLERVRIVGPSLLRTVEPEPESFVGRTVEAVSRLGKRIAIGFEGERWLVVHLMIAGRLRFGPPREVRTRLAPIVSAELVFDTGMLSITEASAEKRATLHAVQGAESLAQLDPGGVEPLECGLPAFVARLKAANRTLKRALTDPRSFAGIGNAYSDEILCHAGLSPAALTARLSDESCRRLFEATRSVLASWRDRLISEWADRFPGPGAVTAFRPDFAVHGKFGSPCGRCGTRVERIVRGEHETNYCPRCQTGGRILADRSLSRLLKDDWPGAIDT